MKAILGFLLTVVVAGAFAVASSAGNATSPRSGSFHATKECSHYTGLADSYCTITWSNLNAIGAGAKVIYASAAGASSLSSDIVLDDGPGNRAVGHVTLDFATATGVVTLSGGTGRFSGFHVNAIVTYNAHEDLWHWDGTYSFIPPGHDN